MKLNRTPTVDFSTGHLTQSTHAWLSQMAFQGYLGVMKREQGFFISTIHVEQGQTWKAELPPDLALCLSFAAAHGVQYVLFDRDAAPQAGLPLYEEGAKLTEVDGMSLHVQKLDPTHEFIKLGGELPSLVVWHDRPGQMMRAIQTYAPGSYELKDLKIEADGEVLDDREYAIEGGAWFTLGDASIRICEPELEPGTLRVVVMPKGMEDIGVEFGRIEIDQADLAEEIANHAEEIEEASGRPLAP